MTCRKVTVHLTPAMARRLEAVKTGHSRRVYQAYCRLVHGEKPHIETSRARGVSYLSVQGSKFNPFLVPTSAVVEVSAKSKQRRSE